MHQRLENSGTSSNDRSRSNQINSFVTIQKLSIQSNICSFCRHTMYFICTTGSLQTSPTRVCKVQAMTIQSLFKDSFRINIPHQDLHSMQSSSFHQTRYKKLPSWHHSIPASTNQKVFHRIRISFDPQDRDILHQSQRKKLH